LVSVTVYETEPAGFTRDGVDAAVNPSTSAAEAPEARNRQAIAAAAQPSRPLDPRARRRRDPMPQFMVPSRPL
jgi:hypothetical protein